MLRFLALAVDILNAIDKFHMMWDTIAAVRGVYEAAILRVGGELLLDPNATESADEGPEDLLVRRNEDLNELQSALLEATDETTHQQQLSVAVMVVLAQIQRDPISTEGWTELKAALKKVRAQPGVGSVFLRISFSVAASMHPRFADLTDAIGAILEHCTEQEATGEEYAEAEHDYRQLCTEGKFSCKDIGQATWVATYLLSQRLDLCMVADIQQYLDSHTH
jgi:hypothetical protein